MTVGKSSLWLKCIKDIDHELIECVERVWAKVIDRLEQTDLEDKITERLVDILREDKAACDLGFIALQHKLKEKDKIGDYTTKGILDIALFYDQDHQTYIAYECKRLNTVTEEKKRKASLAGPYVEEGIVRYATAKYSERLPYGCMIGYVMDGNICFASKQLRSAIEKRKVLINLEYGPINFKNSYFTAFETTHRRKYDNSLIVVRHRLFSMI
ncbi:MAG: hypothetical protein COA45_04005 [Zetaproteobacteria bacterium]|nr:MAG: hypothetical protein COA45_04005 [Zetaproteobacteria bacterium]